MTLAERELQRQHFIGEAPSLVPLPSDASTRRYFRYPGGLLMDALPSEEKLDQFIQIAKYLLDLGFSAPRVFNHDLSSGFLSLEDFGEATYTQLLKAGEDPYPLYELAVDALIALHRSAVHPPEFMLPYSKEELLREAGLLADWYIPQKLGRPLPPEDKQAYLKAWSLAFDTVSGIPQSLVLRDYHVDNLMYLKGRPGIRACGLLDFQDALWGPVVYDLASLLEDARIDLEPALVEHCWQRYFAAFPDTNTQSFRDAGCILSAGRHAKILGIFTRLAVRDGKTHYLNHIPRVEKLLKQCLTKPVLTEVNKWFTAMKIYS